MPSSRLRFISVLLTLIYCFLANATPLDDYIALPEPEFSYSLVSKTSDGSLTTFVFNVTSLEWHNPDLVQRSIWTHELIVYTPFTSDQIFSYVFGARSVPSCASTRQMTLFIGGGTTDKPDPKPGLIGTNLAIATCISTAELHWVPNQPLRFSRAASPLVEDALIAYTWRQFLESSNPNPYDLVRFPMVKSVVKVLDVLEKSFDVSQFIVTGASKRGWVTWLMGAVDKRVVGIIPIVIDMDLVKVLNHQFQAYGGFSFALQDYLNLNLTHWLNTPSFGSLMALEDPLSYLDRLVSIPKLVISATGDEFFLPDDAALYYSHIAGPNTFLHSIAGASHAIFSTNATLALASMAAFINQLQNRVTLPVIEWESQVLSSAVNWTVVVTNPPSNRTSMQVKLWTAVNPNGRDFRFRVTNTQWTARELVEVSPNFFTSLAPTSLVGYTASFIEVNYMNPSFSGLPALNTWTVTTGVTIGPATYPSPPCGFSCSCGSSCSLA